MPHEMVILRLKEQFLWFSAANRVASLCTLFPAEYVYVCYTGAVEEIIYPAQDGSLKDGLQEALHYCRGVQTKECFESIERRLGRFIESREERVLLCESVF